jgi:hypothetical protein
MAYDLQGFLQPALSVAGANPRCVKGLTYEQAERTCAANGARVCHQHELRNKFTKVGCTNELNNTRIITSSRCAANGNPNGGTNRALAPDLTCSYKLVHRLCDYQGIRLFR